MIIQIIIIFLMVIYLYEKLHTVMHDVIIFARSMFDDKNKYYSQVFLDRCL